MSTTIVLPMPSGVITQRDIEVVPETEKHTLVVLSGASRLCLRFNQPIASQRLRNYCQSNFGWKGLDKMQMTVDGQVFEPEAAVTLQPQTVEVGFDPIRAKTLEFRKPAPAKG